MWGKTVRGRGLCKFPVRLSMNDGAVKNVEQREKMDYWFLSQD